MNKVLRVMEKYYNVFVIKYKYKMCIFLLYKLYLPNNRNKLGSKMS